MYDEIDYDDMESIDLYELPLVKNFVTVSGGRIPHPVKEPVKHIFDCEEDEFDDIEF